MKTSEECRVLVFNEEKFEMVQAIFLHVMSSCSKFFIVLSTSYFNMLIYLNKIETPKSTTLKTYGKLDSSQIASTETQKRNTPHACLKKRRWKKKKAFDYCFDIPYDHLLWIIIEFRVKLIFLILYDFVYEIFTTLIISFLTMKNKSHNSSLFE